MNDNMMQKCQGEELEIFALKISFVNRFVNTNCSYFFLCLDRSLFNALIDRRVGLVGKLFMCFIRCVSRS